MQEIKLSSSKIVFMVLGSLDTERKKVENPKEMVSFETIGTSRTEARLRGLRWLIYIEWVVDKSW